MYSLKDKCRLYLIMKKIKGEFYKRESSSSVILVLNMDWYRTLRLNLSKLAHEASSGQLSRFRKISKEIHL